jgi:hypothetical protein
MKKIFAFLAIAAMFTVACNNKPAPTPDPGPGPVDEYTGPVEGTSAWSIVGTLLESNWGAKDYVCAEENGAFVLKNVKLAKDNEIKFRKDKGWDVNRGINKENEAAELAAGTPSKAIQGGGNIIIPADGIYDIYYFAAKEAIVYVLKDAALPTIPDYTAEGGEGGSAAITIDGEFADWAGLAKGTFSQYYGDEECTALTHCKVFANADYIFVYVEWDTEAVVADPGDPDNLDEWGDPTGLEMVPFHCYINTDGDTATGGFSDQFADACSDVLLEGFLYDKEAKIASYAPTAFAWSGDVNGGGWKWAELGAVECAGAGIDGKYEFSIKRSDLKELGYEVAKEFSIGFDIQQSWDSVGILPSDAPSEENASGIVNSLKVVTQ